MKSQLRHSAAIAAVGACWLSCIARAQAFYYGWSAQRDERNGFRFTAAMQWRSAAERFAPNAPAADYCWRQWERIMRLPRHLATPVGCDFVSEMIPQLATSTAEAPVNDLTPLTIAA